MKDKQSYLEDVIDYQDHIYDPGYVTSGRHPFFQNKSKLFAYLLLFQVFLLLFVILFAIGVFDFFPEAAILLAIFIVVYLVVGVKLLFSKQKK